MQRLIFVFIAVGLISIGSVRADTVVANGTIRGQTLIGPTDIALIETDTPGALSDPAAVVGMEARINLYAGRPIRAGDLQAAAVIERNDIVTIRFEQGGLLIITEGRAMGRAAAGDVLRVLNLSSRNTVTAVAAAPGLVTVGRLP